jgi:hypothetical protein
LRDRVTVDVTGTYTETDDKAGKLVHDHKHPVALEQNGLATKQIDAPEALLGVAEEGQP